MAENTIEIEVELVGQDETLKGLDKVKQGAEGIGESFKGVGDLVGKTNEKLGEGLSSVSDAVGGGIEAFTGMSDAIKSVSSGGAGILALLGPIGLVTSAVALAYEAFQQLSGRAQEAEDRAEAMAAAAGDLQSKLEALAEGGVVLTTNELIKFSRVTIEAQVAKERLQKAFERSVKFMTAEQEAQERLNKATAEHIRLKDLEGAASLGLAAAVNEETAAQNQLNKAKEAYEKVLARLAKQQEEVSQKLRAAAEMEQGYEELTKDALKTKALELSERQKALEIMQAERFLQDDLTELNAQKAIAEQEASARKLEFEEMTRDQLLANVKATESLLRSSQETANVQLANTRAVQKLYDESDKKRADQAKAQQQRAQALAKQQEALALQQIARESQLRQLQIQYTLEGDAQLLALARERYDTGLQLAKDDATKRAIIETQYRLEVRKIQEAELDRDVAALDARLAKEKEAAQALRDFRFETAEFNASMIEDQSERELALLQVKYDRELALAEDNQMKRAELQRRYGLERTALEKKESLEWMELTEKALDDYGKGFAEASVGALMFGESFKKSIDEVLKSVAREAGVQALMELAKGTSALAFGSPSAYTHFKSAALFGGVAALAKVGSKASASSAGGGATGTASPSGSALSAPAPQRQSADQESMVFNINFGGAVIYDTRRAAEEALADRVATVFNRPRRGAVRPVMMRG